MEMLAIVASCGSLILAGANAMIFCIVKFNDLKHQEESLKRIETCLGAMDAKLDKNSEKIAKIEGKCSANHSL